MLRACQQFSIKRREQSLENCAANLVLRSWHPSVDTRRLGNAANDYGYGHADRGYFNSPEILACHGARIIATLQKPMTSGAKLEGRIGKQDFVYRPDENVYRCPAGP